MSTAIAFLNETNLTASVCWRDPEGREHEYMRLAPGASYEQQTYPGHAWIARDAASGRLLGETTARDQAETYRIPDAVRSEGVGAAVTVVFENRTPLGVGVYWLDYEGGERLYARLRPGETFRQRTFAGHPWRVRSLQCGASLALVIAGEEAEQTAPIELRSRIGLRPLAVTFANDTSLTVEMVWFDETGESFAYGRLEPGGKTVQRTFAGHAWLVRDVASGTPLKILPTLVEDAEVTIDGAGLRSIAGARPARTTFRNMCAESGDLVWIDYEGQERRYATLHPGAQVTIDSFATHPWRLRADDGRIISLAIAGPGGEARRAFEPAPRDGKRRGRVEIRNGSLLTLEAVAAGSDGQNHVLCRIGQGGRAFLVLVEGTEARLRDAASGLEISRIAGGNRDEVFAITPLDVRTQAGGDPVTVEMTNRTPFDLDVAWVDFDGEEHVYAMLGPGQSVSQPTYSRHVWRARERFSRRLAGVFVAGDASQTHAAFTMRSVESNTPTGNRFVNRAMLTADVYWMDYGGKPQLYRSLPPGASVGFRTFATHPWIVRDRESGRVLDWCWGDRRDAVVTIDDRDLRPRVAEVPVTMSFVNRMPWSVDVAWIGYDGKEQRFATLGPDERLSVSTFETHPWRIRQSPTGDEIGVRIATAEPEQTCEIALRSTDSDVSTEIVFANHSPLTLEVVWVDHDGREQRYATLEPRAAHRQPTCMTHPWIVRDAASGEPVGFAVGRRETQELRLTGASIRPRDGGDPVSLAMANESGLRVHVDWIDHEGNEKRHATLDPGQRFEVTTFPFHAWRVREAQGGAEVDLYIAGRQPRQSHAIRNRLVRTIERAGAELWSGEVAFYEYENFRGRVWILHADTADCRRIAGLNDRVSSIRLGPNTAATVFRHTGFTGANDVIYFDTPSLLDSDVGDDEISSLSIVTTAAPAAARISATSRLTQELSASGEHVSSRAVLRSIVTLPPLTGAVDVWATEEMVVTAGGREHRIDPVRPARLTPDRTGKLVLAMDPDALGGGALMLRTPAMGPRQRFFVFPDVDVHTKLLAMEDDALWSARGALDLSATTTREDAMQVGRALKSLSASVPAASRSLSHGTSRDRRLVPERMAFDRWALEFGGSGQTLFRPATREEVAAAGAVATRLDQQAAQSFDPFALIGREVTKFLVETVPSSVETAVDETEKFVTEDVPGALEDAVDDIVETGEHARTAVERVWDEGGEWIEETADDVAEGVEQGWQVVEREATQIASDAEDAFERLGRDVKEGLTEAVEAVVRVTVEVGGKVYQFVADTVEVIGKAVRMVIEAIGVAFDKLVDFLKDLFDFDDILDMHDFLVDRIDSGIDMTADCVGMLRSQTAGWLSGIESDILRGLDAEIDRLGGGAIAAVDRGARFDMSEASDKLDWLMLLLTGGAGTASGGGENPFMRRLDDATPPAQLDILTGLVDRLIAALAERIEGDLAQISDAFLDGLEMFRRAAEDPANAGDLILGGALSLVKGLVATGVSILETVLDIVFELVLAAIDVLRAALNIALSIPVLSELYEAVTGRKLTPLSLLAFVVAVPATIVGKLILGRPLAGELRGLAQSDDVWSERRKKKGWAIAYGMCHIFLTGIDLAYDIAGSTGRVAPDQEGAMLMTVFQPVGIGCMILAQVSGNPTGHAGGMDAQQLRDGFRSGDDLVRWGHIVWGWQWVYPGIAILDFASSIVSYRRGASTKVQDYGIPILTTVTGAVHMGLMSKYVNVDVHATAANTEIHPDVPNRRRYGWMMDTLPGLSKILAIPELNKPLPIAVGVHAVAFVTFGHVGEAVTYFVRGGVPVGSAEFDL